MIREHLSKPFKRAGTKLCERRVLRSKGAVYTMYTVANEPWMANLAIYPFTLKPSLE